MLGNSCYWYCYKLPQASTLTFFLTCPFGQLTKKSTCPTQSFSCPKKVNKNYKNQRIIISNLCKMFWLLSRKHYLVLSLLILTDIMIMISLIDKLKYTWKLYIKSLVSNDVIML